MTLDSTSRDLIRYLLKYTTRRQGTKLLALPLAQYWRRRRKLLHLPPGALSLYEVNRKKSVSPLDSVLVESTRPVPSMLKQEALQVKSNYTNSFNYSNSIDSVKKLL